MQENENATQIIKPIPTKNPHKEFASRLISLIVFGLISGTVNIITYLFVDNLLIKAIFSLIFVFYVVYILIYITFKRKFDTGTTIEEALQSKPGIIISKVNLTIGVVNLITFALAFIGMIIISSIFLLTYFDVIK